MKLRRVKNLRPGQAIYLYPEHTKYKARYVAFVKSTTERRSEVKMRQVDYRREDGTWSLVGEALIDGDRLVELLSQEATASILRVSIKRIRAADLETGVI